MLHGGIDELLHLGEGDDFVELPPDLIFFHAQDRAVQENIFAAREFLVKARPDFEE